MGKSRRAEFPIGASITIDQLTNNPYPALDTLRTSEPVTWLADLDAWWVTSRELAIEAMRDANRFTVDDERFTTAAVLGTSMLSTDGPEHVRHRSPFAPGFRPGVLRENFDDFLRTEVNDLLSTFDPAGTELRSALAGPLAVRTIARFLGLDGISADDILVWYRNIATAITDLTLHGSVQPEDKQAVARIWEQVETTLHDGQGSAVLKSVQASGALNTDEVVSGALVVMFGAIETSEGMITNLLWHLLSAPGAWQRVRNDRSMVGNAVEESLRLEPAASLIDRYTTEDATLGGVDIPAGELVTISLLGANRDPAHFDNPADYRLDRANAKQHVTFVQGPHACLGIHLARLETAAAIAGALDALVDPVLDIERTTPPAGLIFRKPEQLWVYA